MENNSNASRDDDFNNLENVLADIEGLSSVLSKIGDESGAEWLVYLAYRLQDHHREAHDAFCRINKLVKARERVSSGSGDQAPLDLVCGIAGPS